MPCNKFTVLSVLYAFASTSCLFKYLKVRYSQKLVQDLNYVVRLKGKCVRSKEGIKFLRDCLDFRVVPSSIKTRVKKAKPKHPHSIERAFLRDELEKKEDFSKKVKEEYPRKLQQVCHSLSLMDRLRVCKLLNKTSERLQEQIRTKNTKTMNWLIKSQLGQGVLHHSTIVNLSDVELTDGEKDILCRGLDFGIPPHLSSETIDAEFELCWEQLEKTTPILDPHQQECKAAFSHLSKRYSNEKIDWTGYPLKQEQLRTIRELKKNRNVVITRPDKGNGVVVMGQSDYVNKMDKILSDEKKFVKLGSVEESDTTLLQERALQAFLLRAHKDGHISRDIYERVRPVGATCPRMYGLPKLHKEGVPLRPILSMVRAPQHELAKWLAEIFHPVVAKYGGRALKDSFEFCDKLDEFAAGNDADNTFMCSFDIVSLFTNIPIHETIDIVMDALYRDEKISPPLQPEKLLR